MSLCTPLEHLKFPLERPRRLVLAATTTTSDEEELSFMNHPKSDALFARSLLTAPGGVHSPVRAFRGVGGTPRFIESAQGVYLHDVDGHRYLDFCQSWGPLLYGHRDPDVLAAVLPALARGWSYGTAEPYSLELAELLTRNIPFLEKVRFVNSGTEAVMAALRVARAATGRAKVLKFEGCYHGHVDSMLVKAGSGLAEMSSPDSAGISPNTVAETLVLPMNQDEPMEVMFRKHGHEIAALIIEPLPANFGLLLPDFAWIHRAVKLARANGCLVIFDEVITGLRVGLGGMAQFLGIEPDLVTYGKIIGGGFPVGAYGGQSKWMDWVAPLGPVYQAGTLSANPVAMVAGLTVLKKLIADPPYQRLADSTEKLAQAIEQRVGAVVGLEAGEKSLSVQRFASLFWMIFGKPTTPDGVVRRSQDIPVSHKARYASTFHALLAEQIYLAPSAFEVCFLSVAHQPEHLEALVAALERIESAGGART